MSEKAFSNFFQIARDEKRIKKRGLDFCRACDEMIPVIMPYIEKMIGDEPDIADALKKRDAYLLNVHSQKSKIISIIDKIFDKNFIDYKRLSKLQKKILLDTISDRFEGAYLGSCTMYWHRSPQRCSDCPLKDVCI